MRLFTKKSLFELGIIVLILASISQAITYIGQDEDNYFILYADTYVARVNPQQNNLYVDNALKINIFPTVSIDKKTMQIPELKYDTPITGAKMDRFNIISQEGFLDDVYAKTETTISGNKVVQKITIENTKDSDVVVAIRVSDSNESFVEFAPFVKDKSKSYLILSPKEMGVYGRIDAVYFDPFPPSFVPMSEISEITPYTQLFWTMKIPSKTKYTLTITYIPAYLAQTSALNNFPVKSTVDKEPFLLVETDPLLTFYHEDDFSKIMPNLDLTKPAPNILDQIKDYVDNLPDSTPDFGLVSYIDWTLISASQGYNSLEKSIIFREICRQVGIPTRLHIGKKRGGNYYAWVTAYIGSLEETYDPFGDKRKYPEIYVEPMPKLCRDDISTCRFESMIKPGVVCVGPVCVNMVLVSGIFVFIILVGLSVIMYKSDVIMNMLTHTNVRYEKIDGSYQILSDKLKTDDPLLNEVFDYIRKNNGLVDVSEMAHVLGYSKILITSAIEKLIEDGMISKM